MLLLTIPSLFSQNIHYLNTSLISQYSVSDESEVSLFVKETNVVYNLTTSGNLFQSISTGMQTCGYQFACVMNTRKRLSVTLIMFIYIKYLDKLKGRRTEVFSECRHIICLCMTLLGLELDFLLIGRAFDHFLVDPCFFHNTHYDREQKWFHLVCQWF